jgi:radical SAM protein with 4Fe4S-binding SPASM domain
MSPFFDGVSWSCGLGGVEVACCALHWEDTSTMEGNTVNTLLLGKIKRVIRRKAGAWVGGTVYSVDKTLAAMALRPFELHLELTNICNASCIFCPYQFQERSAGFMSDLVFEKAVNDYVNINGGSVGLTPIVGDALIDPKFLDRTRYLRSLPEIDRIFLTTNAILLDKHGVSEVLTSGLTSIMISTSGFDKESYKRIYRSPAYDRMKENVTHLVQENKRLGSPVNIAICLRTDRPLNEVMRDPDFQPILEHEPTIDFAWSYRTVGGRITREMLPEHMQFRKVPPKREPCGSLYNGAMVLIDGTVVACACIAAMDAVPDLRIGNILENDLLEIYSSEATRQLRDQFRKSGALNQTCANCDAYQDCELYRTTEGRIRADLNRRRSQGAVCKRADKANVPFAGG